MTDLLIFDCEVYRNYFLVAFRNLVTGNTKYFEKVIDQDCPWCAGDGTKCICGETDHPFDTDLIKNILKNHTVIGFNCKHYDNQILSYALAGATNDQLKTASDAIILGNLKSWDFERQFSMKVLEFDNIDIIDVAPGIASLKIYSGRLHAGKMQDLPLEPGALIPADQRENIRSYCTNDLINTSLLFNYLKPQIDLRIQMSKEYKIDLRSKSDTQIAEAVLMSELKNKFGKDIFRPGIFVGSGFKYNLPDFISFKSDVMKETAKLISNTTFVIGKTGNVEMPDALGDYEIKIAKSVYRLGIGGLHSSEKSIAYVIGKGQECHDDDVSSYYPEIFSKCNLYPKHVGPEYLIIYKGFIKERLAAKKNGNKVKADTLKIFLNGSFGRLGFRWSKFYAPELMIHITITGQLAILMLIERLEAAGIGVISANTDGIVTLFPSSDIEKKQEICDRWMVDTGFNLETSHYSSIFSRDINNYIAIKSDGGHKTKGAFAPPGLQKNPQNEICTEAIVDFLENGNDWEKTIRNCRDIRKFVTIRQVKGGGQKDGVYLGKAVRWYYAAGTTGTINYKENGNTVARSEGAKPLMELPDEFPADVNYSWYLNEAREILKDIDYYGRWV